jgi:hypothetical protein
MAGDASDLDVVDLRTDRVLEKLSEANLPEETRASLTAELIILLRMRSEISEKLGPMN